VSYYGLGLIPPYDEISHFRAPYKNAVFGAFGQDEQQEEPGACDSAAEYERGYGDGSNRMAPSESCDQGAYDAGWNAAYGVEPEPAPAPTPTPRSPSPAPAPAPAPGPSPAPVPGSSSTVQAASLWSGAAPFLIVGGVLVLALAFAAKKK
jgi:hypothetical protein